LYWAIYWLVRSCLSLLFRFDIRGLENIPDGPVIIAGNHISAFDPPVVGIVLKRPAWYMAKAELFRNPAFAWLIRQVHAYPVRRGKPDRQALRVTQAVLAQGGAVIIFPEGTRSATGELQDPRRGVAFIARHTKAPVVPVGLVGPYRVGGRVSLWFGPPMKPDPGESLEDFGRRLMAAIRSQIEAIKVSRGLAGPPRSV
jgi:1-acyl-sn-glycerol-3-phosphate acyltransferase